LGLVLCLSLGAVGLGALGLCCCLRMRGTPGQRRARTVGVVNDVKPLESEMGTTSGTKVDTSMWELNDAAKAAQEAKL